MPIIIGSILRWLGISALIGFGIPLLEKGITVAIFLAVVGAIASIAGNLIDSGIVIQGILLSPTGTPVIQTIWGTLRDFINIFFILILLVIAFATIFNVKNYKASDLLPKLIISALLINFSLVIAVWIIDLLWIPAQVFLDPLNQGSSVSGKLANTLRITELFKPLLNNILVLPKFITEAGLRLALLVIKAFLMVWIALIIWARIIILLGLIMLSPIAWLGYAFPNIRERSWGMWWKHILNWGSITIFLFGLIYFITLFAQRLTAQFVQTNPNIGRITFFPTGVEEQLFIIGLVVLGLFTAGLMYVRSLSGSLYDWTMLGFMKIWGWGGAGGKWVTKTTGLAGAASQIKERMAEEGPILGARVRGAREARIAERLAGIAGLAPTFAAQRNLLDQSEKATRDINNRFQQAKSIAEEKIIIDELKTKAAGGAKDPETLAAINALAKKGQLDATLFNQAVENFKDMPLALTKVLSEWKEGKFGGISLDQFVEIMRDKDSKLNLDSRRIMYNFTASDDGKRVAEKMNYDDYRTAMDILPSKDSREFRKKVGGLRPDWKGKYSFDKEEKNERTGKVYGSETEAIFEGIRGASVKDIADIYANAWRQENFKRALREVIKEKADLSPELAANFKKELERKLIREGKSDQLNTFHSITTGVENQGSSDKTVGGIILTPGARFELEKEEREAREAEEEEEEEEKKTQG